VVEELFEMFDHFLCEAGFEPRGGQIVDATLIPVPIQRNTKEENQEIKAGNVPDSFTEKPKPVAPEGS
jgi:IS5 family transposase